MNTPEIEIEIPTLDTSIEQVIIGSTGTSDYSLLTNKPKINNVELSGNKTTSELGINIPTKTSDLTNDSGFLTEHQSLANYSTTALMNTAIALHHDNSKLNTLTAGSNITISNDVISATDTTYTAGANITIVDNVISATGGSGEPQAYLKSANVNNRTLTLTNKDDTTVSFTDTGSIVSGTNDGTNWQTITIDGTTKNIPAGGGSDSVYVVNFTKSGSTITACDKTFVEITAALTAKKEVIGYCSSDDIFRATYYTDLIIYFNSPVNLTNSQILVNSDNTYIYNEATASKVEVATSGTSTTEAKYLTVNNVEWKLPEGGGSSYTFTNGLTESSGTVSWNLNDRLKAGTGTKSVTIGTPTSCTTSGNSSLIVGSHYCAKATGLSSLVIGHDLNNLLECGVQATGAGSIAGGYLINFATDLPTIVASGSGSIAFGYGFHYSGMNDRPIKATQNASIAIGQGVQSLSKNQTVIGKFNVADSSNVYAFIIGNGTGGTSAAVAPSNALTVDWNGNLVCNNIPAPPASDGNYVLKCSIVSGVATYSWVAE